MLIRVGFDIAFEHPQPTPTIVTLDIHPSRQSSVRRSRGLRVVPEVPLREYLDEFDNRCGRLVAPAGIISFHNDAVVADDGQPDPQVPEARQHEIHELPDDTLKFLLASRYCDVDRMGDTAWELFGHTPKDWSRVAAICEFVYDHIRFDYMQARSTRTAWDAYQEKVGVCRDFTHLAVTFCRCMNIPARYCTGYLGDIAVPPPKDPMDFSAWFQAYLGGQWHTFDARQNQPRIGRVLMAYGRDAADVAMLTSFGQNRIERFTVWADVVEDDTLPSD